MLDRRWEDLHKSVATESTDVMFYSSSFPSGNHASSHCRAPSFSGTDYVCRLKEMLDATSVLFHRKFISDASSFIRNMLVFIPPSTPLTHKTILISETWKYKVDFVQAKVQAFSQGCFCCKTDINNKEMQMSKCIQKLCIHAALWLHYPLMRAEASILLEFVWDYCAQSVHGISHLHPLHYPVAVRQTKLSRVLSHMALKLHATRLPKICRLLDFELPLYTVVREWLVVHMPRRIHGSVLSMLRFGLSSVWTVFPKAVQRSYWS